MAQEVYILHIFECIAGNHLKETPLPFNKDNNDESKGEISFWKTHMSS